MRPASVNPQLHTSPPLFTPHQKQLWDTATGKPKIWSFEGPIIAELNSDFGVKDGKSLVDEIAEIMKRETTGPDNSNLGVSMTSELRLEVMSCKLESAPI